MNIKSTHIKFFVYGACIAALGGCGGAVEDQDGLAPQALANNNQVAVNGLALNGYLANAIVWIDARQNNTPDGFEAFAYTDSQGYFSYNPNTGTNYCQAGEASLQTGSQSGDLVIKIAKGTELMTGEPFRSVLTSTITVDTARSNFAAVTNLGMRPTGDTSAWQQQLDASQVTLSSLSSIAYYLDQSGQDNLSMRDVVNDFGFALSSNITDQGIISMDYIANAGASNADAISLFMADATLGRIVDVMTLNLNEATQSLDFGIDGLPLSTADVVYKALAANFSRFSATSAAQRTSLSSTDMGLRSKQMQTTDLFKDILSDAISALTMMLLDANAQTPAVQSAIDLLRSNANIAKVASNLVLTAKYLTNTVDGNGSPPSTIASFQQILMLPTLSRAIAYANAEELVAIISISELLASSEGDWIYVLLANIVADSGADTSDGFYDVRFDLQTLSDDLREIIETNTEVIAAVALNINTGNDGSNEGLDEVLLQTGLLTIKNDRDEVSITPLATLESVDGSSPWAGKTLSLSGLQDDSEQGQIIAFFNQQSNTAVNRSGELIMCVSYLNVTDASDNIEGKRFVGTWSALGGESQSRMSLVAEGFTVQMNVLGETNGRDIPADQQTPSLPRNPNEAYGKFGFTLNDDKATWHSDDASVNGDFGLKVAQSVPASDQACQMILGLGE
jgi:hypothetical protein